MSAKEQLQKAFGASADSSSAIHLSREEATAFIDTVVDESVVLKRARVEKVDLATKHIPRIISSKRFLHAGGNGVEVSEANTDKFEVGGITIHTKELIGRVDIYDSELKHNVEGPALGKRILSLVARKIANEIEEIGQYADTAGTWGATESAFAQFDGFKKRLLAGGNVLNAADTALFADASVTKEKFTKALTSVPTKFRKDLQFFAHDNVVIEYNELFDNSFNRPEFVSSVLGKPINSAPLMRIDDATGKSDVIGTDPMNLIFAMQVEDGTISFEPQRFASKRMTSYFFCMESDFQIEVPEAAVILKDIVTKY